MLIALLIMVVQMFSSGSLQNQLTHIAGPVTEHVTDETRRGEIVAISDELAGMLTASQARMDGHVEVLRLVHADYRSVGVDYDRVVDDILLEQRKAFTAVLDAREAIRERLTEAEWAGVISGLDSE